MSIPIVCGKWLCTCCEKTICSVGGCLPPSLLLVMNSPNKTHFYDNISIEKGIMDNQLWEWWLFPVSLEKLNLFTSFFLFVSLLSQRVDLFNVKQNIFESSHSYWLFFFLTLMVHRFEMTLFYIIHLFFLYVWVKIWVFLFFSVLIVMCQHSVFYLWIQLSMVKHVKCKMGQKIATIAIWHI